MSSKLESPTYNRPALLRPEMPALVAAVRAHALRNYEWNGWDIVVECYSDEDLARLIGWATTAKGAIRKIAAEIGPLATRRADIQATAF